MSTDEETMSNFVNKLISDPATPTEVLEMLFNKAILSDYDRIVNQLLLSGLIDKYLSQHNAVGILLGNFEHIKQYKIIKLFLLNQKDFRCRFSSENLHFLLKWASIDGQVEIIKLLLVDTDPSKENNYAIRAAANNNRIEAVKLLLSDKRVNPNDGRNEALTEAYSCRRYDMLKLLVPLVDMTKINEHGIQNIMEDLFVQGILKEMKNEWYQSQLFVIGERTTKYSNYRLVTEKDFEDDMFTDILLTFYNRNNGFMALENIKYGKLSGSDCHIKMIYDRGTSISNIYTMTDFTKKDVQFEIKGNAYVTADFDKDKKYVFINYIKNSFGTVKVDDGISKIRTSSIDCYSDVGLFMRIFN